MKKTIMKQYAHLIATVGANVQKGQEAWICADLDQPEFVSYLVEACYKAGASKVLVDWNYDPLTKLHAKYQKAAVLGRVEEYETAKLQYRSEHLPCRIFLESGGPDGLKGVPQPKYANALAARSKVIKPYRDAIDNRHQWCIAAVPGEAWAKKVFPGLRKSQAMEKLWEAILFTARADTDPVAAWQAHSADLKARCDYLNDKAIRSLHYTAPNGTDLTVGLIPEALFMGGSEDTLDGVPFQPNMPTEEVFTTPRRGSAEGVVYSTKPLSYQGQLIENFSLRFHEGKVVEVHAEKNEALLKKMVEMDENAAYLGECAFVPKESPINQSGLLFYNTLFDENASCHLALGEGFSNCIRDFDKYTKEQLQQLGVNDSIIHVDFMIGCDALSITGLTEDGREIPIFREGTWAF